MPAMLNYEVSALIQHAAHSSARRSRMTILCPSSPLGEEAGASEAHSGFGAAPEMNELVVGVRPSAAPAWGSGLLRLVRRGGHRSTSESCSTVGAPRKPSDVR